MPKLKSLLVRSEWTIAGRKRKCYHSPNHEIAKGDDVLEVTEGLATRGYCSACGKAMVAASTAALSKMRPLSEVP
jgi:hypothetical protein